MNVLVTSVTRFSSTFETIQPSPISSPTEYLLSPIITDTLSKLFFSELCEYPISFIPDFSSDTVTVKVTSDV